jgi:DNA-binding NtrC family response regulator
MDGRIISASSQSLQNLMEQNKFREDLFYCLHVTPIFVPPLNDRSRDIPLLANHFIAKFAADQGKKCKSFCENILDFIQLRKWSGNILELENFVEPMVALASPNAEIIDHEILPQIYRKK